MSAAPLKSLDQKLARIHADPAGCRDFILADAKDADMAFGIAAPGPRSGESGFKSLADYRDQIREIVRQGLVDIMLLSASNVEKLAIEERCFAKSTVTPAARANDTSDIWVVRGGKYPRLPSRSFRTATLDHIMHARLDVPAGTPATGADLGLYSITFTNNLDQDHQALQDYRDFRIEAERRGFRHFLEVFNPNVDPGMDAATVPGFLNDHVVRTLAGVASRGCPLFLKIPYNGPAALEELVAYDPHLIVGILGGSAGTTHDAFMLIHEARHHGARVALFGRKINLSEHPLTFIGYLRAIVDGSIAPVEAVRAYHGDLARLGIKPLRSLPADLELTDQTMSYR
ncbi:hypothetical protein [Rariglobus hedericola]|uniref:Fructose-bisphosphate aldolase n=1 Tax=Rariglobus hedericola TaxID=2597822 RepID=A0A556QSL0_9BACT|nr:hypothetical protein [Rariglobus hedericola]TSJ79613.1 hypothetical protein FPL22_10105 [Rariglobus hedericola]